MKILQPIIIGEGNGASCGLLLRSVGILEGGVIYGKEKGREAILLPSWPDRAGVTKTSRITNGRMMIRSKRSVFSMFRLKISHNFAKALDRRIKSEAL